MTEEGCASGHDGNFGIDGVHEVPELGGLLGIGDAGLDELEGAREAIDQP